jgi:hypothetical protein
MKVAIRREEAVMPEFIRWLDSVTAADVPSVG